MSLVNSLRFVFVSPFVIASTLLLSFPSYAWLDVNDISGYSVANVLRANPDLQKEYVKSHPEVVRRVGGRSDAQMDMQIHNIILASLHDKDLAGVSWLYGMPKGVDWRKTFQNSPTIQTAFEAVKRNLTGCSPEELEPIKATFTQEYIIASGFAHKPLKLDTDLKLISAPSLQALTREFDSVTIKADLSQEDGKFVIKRVQSGFKNIKNAPNFFFTPQRPQRLHVTCSTAKRNTPGKKMNSFDVWKFKKLARKHLNVGGGYKGTLYTLQLFAHGFDRDGQEIHHHFTKRSDAKNALVEGHANPFSNPGSKLTHAHVVACFGTNPTGGSDGKPGVMKQDMTDLLAKLKGSAAENDFDDIYRDRGPFKSHFTLATFKSRQGVADASMPALDGAAVYNSFELIMNGFLKWRVHQKKTKMKTFTVNNFQVSGTVNQPKIVHENLGYLSS